MNIFIGIFNLVAIQSGNGAVDESVRLACGRLGIQMLEEADLYRS